MTVKSTCKTVTQNQPGIFAGETDLERVFEGEVTIVAGITLAAVEGSPCALNTGVLSLVT